MLRDRRRHETAAFNARSMSALPSYVVSTMMRASGNSAVMARVA